ncbi:MAG: hypothetical protein ACW99F_19770 [Candidatus Hodarchaeales archaeon]|jgi:hypothetical protein
MKINWKKELKPFMEILACVVLSFVLVLGFIHNLIKPFYDTKHRPFVKRMSSVIDWYLDMVLQTVKVCLYIIKKTLSSIYYVFTLKPWRAIKFFIHELAKSIDLLGNVLAGEMIEDLVTSAEKTFFGLGDITISSAIGYEEYTGRLNKLGFWFTNLLDVVFNEEKHSICNYEKEIKNHSLYGMKNYLDITL